MNFSTVFLRRNPPSASRLFANSARQFEPSRETRTFRELGLLLRSNAAIRLERAVTSRNGLKTFTTTSPPGGNTFRFVSFRSVAEKAWFLRLASDASRDSLRRATKLRREHSRRSLATRALAAHFYACNRHKKKKRRRTDAILNNVERTSLSPRRNVRYACYKRRQ